MKSIIKHLFLFLSALAVSFCSGMFIGNAVGLNSLASGLFLTLLSCIPVRNAAGVLHMAVTQNTLIGRSRKKIGGAVFRTWKGINVLQSKPLTVANPRTDAQLSQRSRITQMVAMFRAFLSYVRLAFNEMPSGTTQWAQLMKYNVKTAFTSSGDTATFQVGNLRLSSGTLIEAQDVSFLPGVGREINISWTDNSGQPGANASDRAVAVAVTPDREIYYFSDGATRADEAMIIDIPGSTSLANFRFYFYFDNSSQRKASDSQYFGGV